VIVADDEFADLIGDPKGLSYFPRKLLRSHALINSRHEPVTSPNFFNGGESYEV
jgi:hypothetical protein